MSSISKFAIAGLVAFSVLAVSCKQNDLDPQNSTTTTPTTATADIRDSLWVYMQDVYLWYDKFPLLLMPAVIVTLKAK